MRVKNQPALRLVVNRGDEDDSQRSLCKASSLSAASPRGSLVRACSISETEEAVSPMASPISASVIEEGSPRRSEIRDDHVFMVPNIRAPVTRSQRHHVTVFRDNQDMPRPDTLTKLSHIGERVRWWRKYRGLTIEQLAKKARMTVSTLSDFERGRQKTTSQLHLIAAELRLNAHYLETDKGEPEAGFSQEPPEELEWPFPAVPQHKLTRMKLNRFERAYAETVLAAALAEIEAERRQLKKG